MNAKNIEHRLDDLDSEDEKYSEHPSEFVTQNMGFFGQFSNDLFANNGSEIHRLEGPGVCIRDDNTKVGIIELIEPGAVEHFVYSVSYIRDDGEITDEIPYHPQMRTIHTRAAFWEIAGHYNVENILCSHSPDILFDAYSYGIGVDVAYFLKIRKKYLANYVSGKKLEDLLLISKMSTPYNNPK